MTQPINLSDINSINASMNNFKELEYSILNEKKRMFLATFINYFNNNPDAIIFVHGEQTPGTSGGYAGCFVSRIDPSYVRIEASKIINKEASNKDKYSDFVTAAAAQDISYNKNPLMFIDQDGDKQFSLLPKGLGRHYHQSEFDHFSEVLTLQDIWEDLSWRDGEEPSFNGMVYSKKDLPQIAETIGVDYHSINAEIESKTLTASLKIQPNQPTSKPATL